MNILIIDDDLEKSKIIQEAIEIKHSKEQIQIEYAIDVGVAKTYISHKFYDLIILDLNIPFDDDSNCNEDAGYLLYREIYKVPLYITPGHIIFCTSYDHLLDKYVQLIQDEMFSIIMFDVSKSEWKNQLNGKIEKIIKANNNKLNTLKEYDYDVAIITAVEIERKNVLEILQNTKEIIIDGDATHYIEGYIRENNKEIRVITASQYQMGMTAAAVLSIKLIENFKPKVLAMVGIAAGIDGNFGDIIAASQIWDYSSGKISTVKENNGEQITNFLPSPHHLQINVELKELMSTNFKVILDKIKNDWSGKKIETELVLIKGSMACGPAVIQNKWIIEKYIKPHDRKVAGIDMESYGVLYAATNVKEPRPEVMIFKSISDFADKNKNDDYQEYAAYTSARFLANFLLDIYYTNFNNK